MCGDPRVKVRSMAAQREPGVKELLLHVETSQIQIQGELQGVALEGDV